MASGKLVGGPRRGLAVLFRSRALPMVAAVLAVGLSLPSLGAGRFLDDHYHRTVLLGTSRFRYLLGSPSEMFRFFRGEPERTRRLMDLGLYPWWTDPVLKGEFLQALTVLTHRLDYALWPESPALMHAQNLFWLGTAVAAAAAFYRRMLGATWTAAVAALLFAVDDARGATVGFIANRNVLIAATFGFSALIAHDHRRRDGSRPAPVLAVLLLLAALFSKEEGTGTCAYLAAYALFADPKGWRRGCVALWPYVVAAVAWAVVRASWGYGVRDMGVYIDPPTDSARFLAAAAWRWPVLLLGQWGPIPSEITIALGARAREYAWYLAIAVLGILLVVMAPLLRRDPLARFWAAGMLLAAVPVSATFPMDRLLTFVGLGASGLLAQYLTFVLGGKSQTPSHVLWRLPAVTVAWLLVVVHLVIAPLVLPYQSANAVGPKWLEERLYVRTPLGSSLDDRTVVVVNAPSPMNANYLILLRELNGQSGPRRMRVLAPAIPSVTIRRVDEHSLMVRPADGYLRFLLDQIFRSERRPLAAGEQVRLEGMTVTIDALTPDGNPAEATFRFDVPLESPSLVWLCFRGTSFVPFEPPPVGREETIDFDWKAMLMRRR